jgi:hypothetical protein
MTRMRTHKTKKYFNISNITAQDHTLSFTALGLLTYCLSMPEDWEFYPKKIWKERKCGRDKIYGYFNELIKTYHCIRIKTPNPNAKGLPGEVSYELFDDIEDCKERIKQLQSTERFLEHGDNFKNKLRRPGGQVPVDQDPVDQYNTKDTMHTNKTKIQNDDDDTRARDPDSSFSEQAQLPPSVVGHERETEVNVTKTNGTKLSMDLSVIFRHFLKFPQYSTATVQEAVRRIRIVGGPINNILKYLEQVCESILAEQKEKIRNQETKKPKTEYASPKKEKVVVNKPTITMAEYMKQLKEKEGK